MPLVFILLAILLVVAIGFGAASSRDALDQSWGSVADRFGLLLTPAEWNKSPRLAGEIDGYPLIIDIHKKGSGKSQSTWTRFRLGVPSLNLGLQLKHEGFLSAISKAFGGSDIEVGDAAFDQRMLIKGDDADAIRTFLNPDRRERIEEFFVSHRGTIIDDQGITWATQGRMGKAAFLFATIDEMLRVARSLAPHEARPDAAAGAATAAFAVVEDPVERSEPKPELDSDPDPSPELEAEPVTDGVTENEPPAESNLAAPPVDTLGIAEFCDSVFAPGSLSFAAAQTFRENYQSQAVTWSGTLQSAEPYKFDFVFGAGGGIKAVVEIYRVDGAMTGRGEVNAIVQLPADTPGIEARLGERVSFSGTLTKVDGLQRQVFVSNAELSR